MLTRKRESWQAPRRTNWTAITNTLAIMTIIALASALAWALTRPAPEPPAGPPPGPTARALTPLETAGINAILARYKTPIAYTMSGDITVGKNTFGIQLATIADNSTGTGTLTAGGLHGDMLLTGGAVYLRGETAFWSALGVTGAAPPAPGWVSVGPEFMDGKLFYPAQRWTAALTPNAKSTLDGTTYTATPNTTATFTGDTITAIDIPGTVNAKITTTTPAQVTDTARPLIDERGGTPPALQRATSGRWMLPAAAPTEPTDEPATTTATPTP